MISFMCVSECPSSSNVTLDPELISYDHITTQLVGGDHLPKKPVFFISNRIGMKFADVVLQLNKHRLTQSDLGYFQVRGRIT